MAMTAAVKDELARVRSPRSCCRKAEVSALLRFGGGLHIVGGRVVVEAELDTSAAARRLKRDVAEVYGQASDLLVVSPGGLRKTTHYVVRVARDGEALARQTGLLDGQGRPVRGLPPQVVSGPACDAIAAWRGAFLAHGSLTEPGRSSSLEITCPGPEAALALVGAVVGPAAMRAARHRIEHAEMVDAAMTRTLADLGIFASVQPVFDALWGGPDGMYAERLGPARARTLNPFAALAAAGVPLAFGSDSPVTPLGPWEAVRAAAWHSNPGQRMSARAAFAAHTRGGWRAAGRDDAGVLAPGAPATYAVWSLPGELVVQAPDDRIAAWSTDPRSGIPGLPDLSPGTPVPRCLRTVVRGVTVFDPAGGAGR